MPDITISFTCKNHNHVLLLTALYDLLTEEIDDSIAAQEYTGWIIDEIARRLPALNEFDGGDRMDGLSKQLLEIYIKRASKTPPPIPQKNI